MKLCRYITSEQTLRKVLPMKTKDPTYQTDGTHAALYADRYYWTTAHVRVHTQIAQKPILEIGLKWLHCPSQAVSILSSCSQFPFCPQTHTLFVKMFVPRFALMLTFHVLLSLLWQHPSKEKGEEKKVLERVSRHFTDLNCWEKAVSVYLGGLSFFLIASLEGQ